MSERKKENICLLIPSVKRNIRNWCPLFDNLNFQFLEDIFIGIKLI